jgi:hypothetical protein
MCIQGALGPAAIKCTPRLYVWIRCAFFPGIFVCVQFYSKQPLIMCNSTLGHLDIYLSCAKLAGALF